MYLIFDTETTGLPKRFDAPITDTDNWPRCIQIAWQLHDTMGNLVESQDFIVKPEGFSIPFDSEQIHGISTDLALEQGVEMQEVLDKFNTALNKAKFVVGHNVKFDLNIMGAEFHRFEILNSLQELPVLDTCTETTARLCQLAGGRGGRFKLPTLSELHNFLFAELFSEAHNATADVEATTRCFFELIRIRNFTPDQLDVDPSYFDNFSEENPKPITLIGLKHINLKAASDAIRAKLQSKTDQISTEEIAVNQALLADAPFAHLHNHTQYSILQATSSIKDLVYAAGADNMPAIALTDTANMMGAFHFVDAVNAYNKNVETTGEGQPVKGIVGCEFNICEDHTNKSFKDNGYQVVLLAKNKRGYENLAKMSSISYTEGFYYVPRIDKEVVLTYKEDIIVLSGGVNGEVSSKLLNVGEKQAEEAAIWWKEHFKEDFYIEVLRHGQEDEERLNELLIPMAQRLGIKMVACNNTFYIKQEDANAHDILLCVKDGEKQATPIGRGRGYRYGLPNSEYYFKSSEQMKALFQDLPEAILSIGEIIDKVEAFSLSREVLLPKFDIPEDFIDTADELDGGKRGENAYLKHLTYIGAKLRYGEITPEIKERLDFELEVIANTGYPGYFLIVQDLIAEARRMDVGVGPGRGSAAGSAVAYCLKITNIDPIEYNLLFERFLNPERVSMPDIDIDFDDEGRGKVMDYVIEKYGKNQVAQIITYGTMAAKSSIRDTARVLDLPLSEANRISNLVPTMTKLSKVFGMSPQELQSKFRSEELPMVNELIAMVDSANLDGETVRQARILEGSVRNTGIHACGVIITPDDITKFVPIATAKDTGLSVTQFDNSVVERAGLLKMDFLGLKTLTIIKDAVKIVKHRHGLDLDPDNFPLDDEKTYELFQRGETIGIFQYESPGMQKHMRSLKPTNFADLIAMNALYRPGPMEYIPSFIRRKHGEEEITYDLDVMEEYLEETYGITVYQEQVMLLSQKLADFTRGEADVLRKAMGKKDIHVLEEMKPKFIEQAQAKGHAEDKLEKIWKDWEAFASYAFNKSHSTCYASVAYQTAYLKAHYPAEYMAAVLSNNMNDIKQVTFFMEECKRMGLKVLSPDVNESFYKFTVNEHGHVRFGMGAVKGVGAGAVATIVENRENEKYRSVFDLAKRIDLRAANKRSLENLAYAGGFDSFNNHRAQYFHDEGDGVLFLEKVIRYAARVQESENSAQVSLFGDASEVQIPEPVVPPCEPWATMKELKLEKEVVGIYISGHPLDDYKIELGKPFSTAKLSAFHNLEEIVNSEWVFGGIVTDVQHRETKDGRGWAMFIVEDFTDSYEFRIFKDEYMRHRHYLVPNTFIHAKVRVNEGFVNRSTGVRSQPRLQFVNIESLQDVLNKGAKKLSLQMPLGAINENSIEQINSILDRNSGEKPVHFLVYDYEERIKLHLKTRSKKVDINRKLIEELEVLEFKYKIN